VWENVRRDFTWEEKRNQKEKAQHTNKLKRSLTCKARYGQWRAGFGKQHARLGKRIKGGKSDEGGEKSAGVHLRKRWPGLTGSGGDKKGERMKGKGIQQKEEETGIGIQGRGCLHKQSKGGEVNEKRL